jgi:hypothetical protein
MRIKNFIKKTTSFLLLTLVLGLGISLNSTPVKAANEHTVTITTDKANVKPGDTFTITIAVKNTSTAPIANLEVRVPFLRTIQDANFQLDTPSFNKVLDSVEYPAGFQARSWLLNTLAVNETKSFALKYQVVGDPKTANGLVSNYTLPITWVDPADAPSNQNINVKTFRADVYIQKKYNKSYNVNLAKLDSLDNQVSLVTLNSKYTYPGSKTTNLKTITSANIASFPNFVLESEEVKMEWTTPIDFSAATTASQLSTLDANLQTSSGRVVFNSANLPFLAKGPVKVTFKNMDFLFAPKVKIGSEVKEILDAKGVYTQATKTVVLDLPILQNTSIAPSLQFDAPVIETHEDRINLEGKVGDTKAKLTYKINGGEAKEFFGIDLQTGSFSIPLEVDKADKSVEVIAKSANGEETAKIITVKYTIDTTPTTVTTEAPSTISLPLNNITLILGLAALGVAIVIGSFIYYLTKNKRNQKLKDDQAKLNLVVNRVSSVKPEEFNSTSIAKDQEEEIDLTSLKKKYEVTKPEEGKGI